MNGIKTGITQSAGPCLATSLNLEGYNLVVVILNSKSMETRWIETMKLANWSISRLKKMKKFMDKKNGTGPPID